MRILSLTAGAAQMYCGSCLRDNALARELIRQGHEVSLIPVYTPTKTDEPNQSDRGTVLFGGINVYLQQKSWFFRHARFLDRILDSRWALNAAAKRSIAVEARELGELTVAMLQGEGGPLDREFHKLEEWLRHQPRPDLINLPNTLLISMAPAIRHVYDGPIVFTLQGEDLFLDQLPEPYRTRSLELIARHASAADGFISISRFYSGHMARFLNIPEDRIHIVPLGLDTTDFERHMPARPVDGVFRAGYLARIAPEKGLHFLAEAWREFRKLYTGPARLEAAGYLAPEHQSYLRDVEARFQQWGLAGEFHYHGELDRQGKLDYLASLDAFSVPAVYHEPKGLYVLEALAAGVPVVAPDRGVYPEHLARCRGGLLFDPESPAGLARHFHLLASDPQLRQRLGTAGRQEALANATLPAMAARTLEVYESFVHRSAAARAGDPRPAAVFRA